MAFMQFRKGCFDKISQQPGPLTQLRDPVKNRQRMLCLSHRWCVAQESWPQCWFPHPVLSSRNRWKLCPWILDKTFCFCDLGSLLLLAQCSAAHSPPPSLLQYEISTVSPGLWESVFPSQLPGLANSRLRRPGRLCELTKPRRAGRAAHLYLICGMRKLLLHFPQSKWLFPEQPESQIIMGTHLIVNVRNKIGF